MVSPHEAVTAYIDALRSVDKDLLLYEFQVNNRMIRIGYKQEWGTQWAMTWDTPESLMKKARIRRLDNKHGDPRVA